MATRRSTAPRKRPSPGTSGAGVVAAPLPADDAPHAAARASSGDVDSLVEEMRQDVLAQIDGALREEGAFDQQSHDSIMEQFSAAFADALGNVDSTADGDADLATLLQQGAKQLKEIGAAEDDGSGDLVRQLDRALEPLERRETKVAFEFSRRLQADGQESALAWLKKQQQADQKDSAAKTQGPPAGSTPARIPRDTVTQSKSRRLRGPPKAV